MLTFASGGWVLVGAGVLSVALIVWALAGAFSRQGLPLIGDGRRVASYRFDLSPCLVPPDEIVAAGMRKDALAALVDPPVIPGTEVALINARERGKYLVSTDRVIGVTRNGESRAYPLQIMNCHEIVNDTLGGVEIAVTYNPLCDSVVVLERKVGGVGGEGGDTLEFGVSGLLYNSNLLMYDRRPEAVGESLWSQLQARAIAGPAAEARTSLRRIEVSLVSWADWFEGHPDTTVLKRDPRMIKRYQQVRGPYESYFISRHLKFPVNPPPPAGGLEAKQRVVVVESGGERAVYALDWIAKHADSSGTWTDTLGGVPLVFEYQAHPQTVLVRPSAGDSEISVTYAFWFAWHAMYPDEVVPAVSAADEGEE